MTNPKFLVVDDEPAMLDIASAIFQALGCDVETYPDGASVLRRLEKPGAPDEFEGIFLDVMMPNLSGIEVVQKLKSNEKTQNLPIVLLTAMNTFKDIIAGYNHGADYYITKPITQEQIRYALDLLLTPEEGKSEDRHILPEA
jgi:two-component system, sensor histidine kinase ChiS